MPKRRRQVEEQYHVEVIEKARVTDEGDWEYYVKWGGYSSDENSWEPTENVEGCSRLLKSFWDNVGMDNQDYHPGDILEPTKEWIAQERAFFQEAFGNKSYKRKKHESAASTSVTCDAAAVPSTSTSGTKHIAGKATKHKSKTKRPGWEWVPVSDDDEPVIVSTRKKKIQGSIISLSSDDSDTPLSQSIPAPSKVTAKDKGKGKVPKKSSAKPRPTRVESMDDSDHDSLFSDGPSPTTQDNALEESATSSKKPTVPKLSIKVPAAKSSTNGPGAVASPSAATPQTAGGTKAPTHKERQAKPKVQMIPMQLVDKSGNTTFISTKQKIAEKSGHTTSKPSPVVTSVPPPPPPPTNAMDIFAPQKSLAKLSFKKKSTATTTTTTNATIAGPSSAHPSPSINKQGQQSKSYFSDREVADSPINETGGWGDSSGWGNDGGWDNAHNTGGWGSDTAPRRASGPESPMVLTPDTAPFSRRAAPAIPRQSSIQQPPPTPKQPSEAEAFLNSIMPDDLAAPMDEPHVESPQGSRSLATTLAKKVPVFNLNVPKKWTWQGELYMEVGPDRADRICNVSLSDLTDARPMGLRLDILYTSEVSVLRLKKFHEMTDLYMILRACAPLQQCCKVSHAAQGDFDAMTTLGGWMARKNQFTYADVYLDNDAVGLLVIFPSAITEVCNLFKVPAYLRDQSSLLAALVPWMLNPNEMVENMWAQPTNHIPFKGDLEPELLRIIDKQGKTHQLAKRPMFATGLRTHNFTPELYNFLTRSPRAYCIWHTPPGKRPGAAKLDGTEWETRTLVAVLEECYAKNAGHKADVRAVFVHVSALSTFSKLPALGIRRFKQPDTRMYSYGTHASIPPDRWGLREIYPIGGVMTFTVAACQKNVFDVCRLVEQVDQHPLWVSYIHPYVLACLFRGDHPRADPEIVVERGEFLYQELLKLIEDGTLSLLYSPPLSRSPRLEKNRTDVYDDPHIKWAEWVLNLPFASDKEILAECVRMFEAAHPNVSERDIMGVTEKEVLADLGRMQLQPTIMDNYRRFVAITGSPSEDADGVEFTTAEDFEFRDDWFSSRAVAR